MRTIFLLTLTATASLLLAQVKTIRGKVTYISSGTVYTSLGRNAGLSDSTLVYVVEGSDTTALLRAFATSSQSSACTVLWNTRPIAMEKEVVARVIQEIKPAAIDSTSPSPDTVRSILSKPEVASRATETSLPPWMQFKGRVGVQYYTTRYENTQYNTTQPGVVMQLQGISAKDHVKFDLYSNIRTLSRGSAAFIGKNGANQSRVYRASVEYDDGTYDVAVGRIIPLFSPSVGYVDGLLFSRRFGDITAGVNLGFQPGADMRGVSTDYRKVGLFVNVKPFESIDLTVTPAYARTYFRSVIDREVMSLQVVSFGMRGLNGYFYSEFDLRKKIQSNYALSPALTNMYMNVNYQATSYLSVGVGTDASRPMYSFSTIRDTPDSLLESKVRTGLSLRTSVYAGNGISVSNIYTPRSSESRFGRTYSDNAILSIGNVLSSGIILRTNVSLGATEETKSRGYGIFVQRNFAALFDVTVRFQVNDLTLNGEVNRNQTVGFDAAAFFSRNFALIASFDQTKGYGLVSNTLFTELSYRF